MNRTGISTEVLLQSLCLQVKTEFLEMTPFLQAILNVCVSVL